MTPPFDLEINRTVAALAAETRVSPIVAHMSLCRTSTTTRLTTSISLRQTRVLHKHKASG